MGAIEGRVRKLRLTLGRADLALAVITALTGLFAFAGSAAAATPAITEFPTGDDSILYGITAGADGRLWYVDQLEGDIGFVNPDTGGTSEIDIDWNNIAGITSGPDNNLYYGIDGATGLTFVGDLIPSSGLHSEAWYGMGAAAGARFPAVGPDGIVYVTQHGGNRIDAITPATPPAAPTINGAGTSSSGTLPTANAYPEAIVAGPSDRSAIPFGSLWFTESSANKIGRFIPLGGGFFCLHEYIGLTGDPGPEGIALGPDGNIWFTEYRSGKVGRLTPPSTAALNGGNCTAGTPSITEFPLPNGLLPEGIVAGPDGNMWIAHTGRNEIVRMNLAGQVTGQFTAPSGTPAWITAGPDGNLWFTEQLGDRIGRINTDQNPPAFRDTDPITVPTVGAGDPPASVAVSGLQGTITDVNVRLTGITHTFPDDMDLILQSPTGQAALVMSDVGSAISSQTSGTKRSYPANGITLTLDDQASRSLSDRDPLVSGIYKPTNVTDSNESTTEGNLPGPFGTTFPSALSTFNGQSANGTWKLWVNDDNLKSGDIPGTIYGGWGLDIDTTGPPPPPPVTQGTPPAKKKKCKKKRKKAAAAKKCKKVKK
jgi:streptogramin lyase